MTTEHPCYRCGHPGHVEWAEITSFGDAGPVFTMAASHCVTPGCTEPDGSRRLDAPTPAELSRKADDILFATQRRLIAE